MKGALIIALLAVYVLFVLTSFGGHYVHILAVAAMAIYIYGLFTAKSAGVSNDIDSSSTSHSLTTGAPLPQTDAPKETVAQTDPNRNLPESN